MTLSYLATDTGRELLAQISALPAAERSGLGTQLRASGLPAEVVSELLAQADWREAARPKFGPAADSLFFTRTGLEQATRLQVAALHAQRFASAGVRRIADLGCGIGADSLAFVSAGLRVLAVEQDPHTAKVAALNLAPFPEAEVRTGAATTSDLDDVDAVWVDPARRVGDRRLAHPESRSPPLSQAIAWARQVDAAGIKIAPGIDLADLPEDSHVQWVSCDRTVVEAVIWLGTTAPRPGRSAVIMRGSDVVQLEGPQQDPRTPHDAVPTASLGNYLFEPDGAVLRAGLLGDLAGRLNAGVVSDGIGFLTGDTLPTGSDVNLVRTWEIAGVYSKKEVGRALREAGVGRVEVLTRGWQADVQAMRASWKLEGDNAATVALTRVKNQHRAIILKDH